MIRKGIFIVLQCPVEWKHLKIKNPGSSLRRGGGSRRCVRLLRFATALRVTPPLPSAAAQAAGRAERSPLGPLRTGRAGIIRGEGKEASADRASEPVHLDP